MKKKIYLLVFILFTKLSVGANSQLDIVKNTNNNVIVNDYSHTKKINDFDHFPLENNIFKTIIIDKVLIKSPRTMQELDDYLIAIENKLRDNNKDFLIFKYGSNDEIKLKLPYLGTGNHAFVFEIIDGNKTTNKILKLNIKRQLLSLKAGMKENHNYNFWQQQAAKHSFTVAKIYDSHPFGLYSIKEKNQGVSLTKFLLDKNLIFITDATNNTTEYKKMTSKDYEDPQLQKIYATIREILDIIISNPNNCSSISPNNLFIEFEKMTKNIKNIELIDYGISSNKMQTYAKIKDFNQYLEIAAERLNKYLRLKYKI